MRPETPFTPAASFRAPMSPAINISAITYRLTAKNSLVLCVGGQTYVSDDPQCRWVVIRPNGVSFCRVQPEPMPGELVLMVR